MGGSNLVKDPASERLKAFKFQCLRDAEFLRSVEKRMVLIESPVYLSSLGHFTEGSGRKVVSWSSSWGLLLQGSRGKGEARVFLQGGVSLGLVDEGAGDDAADEEMGGASGLPT